LCNSSVKPISAVDLLPAAHGFGKLRTGQGTPFAMSKHQGAAGMASVYASYPPTPLYSCEQKEKHDVRTLIAHT
jgi:hypothetical protein